ncbi:hypothetical protein ACIA8K_16035 [Catenuloplanes sp. NPDC051500]|uniref:hypothetical protein n=1 Tax=Catenuloplanes sp. NPDC051500 TaxID=3363959 RepID=UPI0037B28E3B
MPGRRQATAIGGRTSVLDGVLVVPPSRQNSPVNRLPVPQPLLVAGPGPTDPDEDGSLHWPHLFSGVWHAAVVLAAALAAVTTVVALIMVQQPASAPPTYFSDWLATAVAAIGLALGGGPAGVDLGSVTLHAMPILLTAGIAGPLAGLAMRDERRRPSPALGALVTRSVVTAGAVAGAVGFAAGLSPVPAVTFALVLVVTLVARATASPAAAPERLRAVVRPVSDALALAGRFGVTLLIGAGLTGAVLAVVTGSSPTQAGTALTVLPSLVLALLGVRVVAAEPAGTVSLVTDPSWWTLLLLVPAGSVLVAAVRHALSRPVGAPRRPLATTAVTTAAVVLAALAGAGPAPAGAAVAGLVWGVLLALTVHVAGDLALVSRRLLTPAEPSWRALLYGTARARAWAVTAVAATLVLPVLAVGGVVLTNRSVFGPDRAARDYLAAVSAGDAAAALALRGDSPGGPLLTGAVLRAPGVDRPENVRVVTGTVDGGTATVTASFTLGGETQVMTMALAAGARRYDVFDEWRVVSGLGTVTPDSALPVTVGGVTLDGGVTVAAFPARYPMALADPAGTFSAERTSLLVLGGATTAAPGARMSEQTRELVKRALDDRLSACAARTDMFMFDCPFDLRAAHIFFARSARYTLQRTAQVELRAATQGGVDLVTTTPGTVEYRAMMPDGADETGTVDYTVSGTATLGPDGTVTIELASSAPAGS